MPDELKPIVGMNSKPFRVVAIAAVGAAIAATGIASAAEADQPHFSNTQVFGLSGGPHGAATQASVRVTRCSSSSVLANRRFFVQAHMLPVPATQTMQIRFRFFMKQSGQAEREVKISGSVGYWEPAVSATKVKNWIFNKQVDSLPAPASYRMEVDFQWLGSSNRVLKNQTIRSSGCTQTDLRPDLAITNVVASPIEGGSQVRYAVTVTNSGKGAASASKLVLTVISPYSRIEVNTPAVKVGESKVVSIIGPRCDSGGTALLEVDPGNLLGESSTANNGHAAGCSPSA